MRIMTRPPTLATMALGLALTWSCTVVDKKDYEFTDDPSEGGGSGEGDTGATGGSSAAKGGAGGAKGGSGGKGGAAGSGVTAGKGGATGGVGADGGTGGGVGATGGTSGDAGDTGAGGSTGGTTGGAGGTTGGTGGAAGNGGGGTAGTGGSPAGCGNGNLDSGEACDLGSDNGTACEYGETSCSVCTPECEEASGSVTYCGDRKKQAAHEDCDHGNTVDEACDYDDPECTGCSSSCTSMAVYCGDGAVNGRTLKTITLEYVGVWYPCPGGDLPFYLNDVALPLAGDSSCMCGSDIKTVEYSDSAILAAVRHDNNVLELRGFGYSSYTQFNWARLTFAFDGGPDVKVLALDPAGIAESANICTAPTYGPLTSQPFSVPVENCDADSGCESCSTPGPKNCGEIFAADRSAPNGGYAVWDGAPKSVYCDMTHGGVSYEVLGMGPYAEDIPGYTVLTIADLVDPTIQQAFLWLYTAQGGLVNLHPGFASTNCCFRSGNASEFFTIGGSLLFPAELDDYEDDQWHCNEKDESDNIIGAYTADLMRLHLQPEYSTPGTPQFNIPTPQTGNFFDALPVSYSNYCTDGENPAFFVKRY